MQNGGEFKKCIFVLDRPIILGKTHENNILAVKNIYVPLMW